MFKLILDAGKTQSANRFTIPAQHILAAIIVISPSIFWIIRDQTVWPYDQAWYGEVSVELWNTLVSNTSSWATAMIGALCPKAPGLSWLGQFFVPLGQSFGSIEIGLMVLVIAFQFSSLLMIGSIARSISPKRILLPLLAVLAMASAPLFVGMSTQFMTEGMQCFTATYFFWIAAQSNHRSCVNTLMHLLLATGLAMSAKISSPMYCFMPGAIALYGAYSVKTGRELSIAEKLSTIVVGLFGALILLAIVEWYWHNFAAVIEFLKQASSGEDALYYGQKGSFFCKLWKWIASSATGLTIEWSFGLVVVTIVAGVVVRIIHFRTKIAQLQHRDLLALASATHICIIFIIFPLQINEETRYLLPLLPSVVILLVWSVEQFSSSSLAAFLVGVFILQWGIVEAQSLGLKSPSTAVNVWVHAYMKDAELKNIVSKLIELTSTKRMNFQYTICGVETPWLNSNSLSFYAAKHSLQSRNYANYTSLGYAEKNVTKAWTRLNTLRIGNYISLDIPHQSASPDVFNTVSVPVLQKIMADSRFRQVPFESSRGVVVYKNEDMLSEISLTDYTRLMVPDEQTAQRFGITDFVAVAPLGPDGLLVHPLPPSVGVPTAVAVNIDNLAIAKSTSGPTSLKANIMINNPDSLSVHFRMEVRSGKNGTGEILAYTEKTITPGDGEQQLILPLVVTQGQLLSIVLSTQMEPGFANNYYAHAIFSGIRFSTK